MDVKSFWKCVDRQDDGCWLWIGPAKYFQVRVGGERGAGRISYFLRVGEIDGRLERCPKNSMCVNPTHLKVVEFAPVHKRRGGRQSEIERLYDEGYPVIKIAEKMGCHTQTVYRRLRAANKRDFE